MTRLTTHVRRGAIAMAASLVMLGLAEAQTSNATLRGSITGPSPHANAEVSATNTETGFVLRTKSNAEGEYVITGLPPGPYRIDVTGSDGKKYDNLVTLQVGQSASLDLPLGETPAAATSLDRVVVTGAAIADRKTSEVGTYVTPQQIQRLPQVTRNFLGFADLAPGVNVEYDAQGNVKVRSGASGHEAVNVFIDGVGQKDYVLHGGGSPGQTNSRGNPFPQSALAEYKVITQNYKAEFDQVSSAAITAVTKSGTNQFHGDAFVDYTSGKLRTKTPGEEKAGVKSDTMQQQYGVSLGGPIIKDRLHYFMAYEGKKNRDPQTVAAGGPAAAAAQLPSSQQALLGPVNSPFHEDLFFGKVDWTPNEMHRFDLSVKLRKESDRKHVGNLETTEFGSDYKVDETRVDLKHQFSSERLTNEFRVTYEDATFSQQPVNTVNGARYRYIQNGTSGLSETGVLDSGGNDFYQRKGQKGWALQNDLTLTGFQAAGSHVIKIGGKLKWITVDAAEQANLTPQFFYDLAPGGSATQPYKVLFGSPLGGIGNGSVEAKNTQYGVYAQDDWELNRKLTLNLGVRYDYERSPSYLNYTTPSDAVAALNAQDPSGPAGQTYAQSLAKGGVNVNDYISTGSNRKAFSKAWAPRLGFSYDLFGDKQHVVFGGAGRSYDRNIFDVLQLERTKGTFPTYNIGILGDPNYTNCAVPSSTCVAWNPNFARPGGLAQFATGQGREIDLLKNDLKTPYSDQFSLGIRDAIGIWQTEVTLSRIEHKNGFVWLLGNRRPDGLFYAPGTNAGPPYGNGVPGYGNLILGTNGVKTITNALLLKADKPWSRESGWGATFAYTYSQSKENHNSQDDSSYALDYPTVATIPMLPSTVVPRHKLVATGSYDLPYGVLLSGKLTLASPKPIYGFDCTNQECRAETVNGNSFRQVDLLIAKAFDLGQGIRMVLRADVLNLFDYRNWDTYNVAWGGPNQPSIPTPTGTLAGPTRTIKVGMSMNW
jgi:outer membrane receptor protein involved in Fe transport